ncbi:unnamed protein product [Chrysoparadoxa australica]
METAQLSHGLCEDVLFALKRCREGEEEEAVAEAVEKAEALLASCGASAGELRQAEGGELELEFPTVSEEDLANKAVDDLAKSRWPELVDLCHFLEAAQQLVRECDGVLASLEAGGMENATAASIRMMGDLAALDSSSDPELHACIEDRARGALLKVKAHWCQELSARFRAVDPLTKRDSAHPAASPEAIQGPFVNLITLQASQHESREIDSVWALDEIIKPVALRFSYNFSGDRPTNQDDRPEWFFSFLSKALAANLPIMQALQALVGPACQAAVPSPGTALQALDCEAYFARGLVLLARRKLRELLPKATLSTTRFSHLIEEMLGFEEALAATVQYGDLAYRCPNFRWPRCIGVMTSQEERFQRWLAIDHDLTQMKCRALVESDVAWQPVADRSRCTQSAVGVCALFTALTSRYSHLDEAQRQLAYISKVQRPLLSFYYGELYNQVKSCNVRGLWRPTKEHTLSKGTWERYCSIASACEYVWGVLVDSEDDATFIWLHEVVPRTDEGGRPPSVLGPGRALNATLNAVAVAAKAAGIEREEGQEAKVVPPGSEGITCASEASGARGASGNAEGSLFGQESTMYREMLEAMCDDAVEAVCECFDACLLGYSTRAMHSYGGITSRQQAAEPSELLVPAVSLLDTAMATAAERMPAVSLARFWQGLAKGVSRLVLGLVMRHCFSWGGGVQLHADMRGLMEPFKRVVNKPENVLKQLSETALLLSLPPSQLQSIKGGLDALNASQDSPGAAELLQMENMLESVGVRKLPIKKAWEVLGLRSTLSQ